ncbi:MAG: methionyl-tRNA formyltransferase [Anaerolineales bacterium]|nr:methionyl-tRNA formyltransferase [Anaerolineales bacterium]
MEPRIVFMGSPDFALPTLRSLADNYPVTGVVTQPDRPTGRGRNMTPPPVKVLADELDIPTIQPEKLRTEPDAKAQILSWQPDIIVVAAFGQILRKDVLTLATYGCLNVHASLLPRWRGVSPIQSAILHGDQETGVTIMKMDEGIDTGDIISQRTIPITPDDTGGSIFEKLAQLGGELMIATLMGYLRGEYQPRPQGVSPTPYAPMLQKSDGELDFNQSAQFLTRQIQAFNPWPGTFTHWNGAILKIHKAHVVQPSSVGVGEFTIQGDLPAIGTSSGLLVIEDLQPAGKKSMPGDIFLRGAKQWP